MIIINLRIAQDYNAIKYVFKKANFKMDCAICNCKLVHSELMLSKYSLSSFAIT